MHDESNPLVSATIRDIDAHVWLLLTNRRRLIPQLFDEARAHVAELRDRGFPCVIHAESDALTPDTRISVTVPGHGSLDFKDLYGFCAIAPVILAGGDIHEADRTIRRRPFPDYRKRLPDVGIFDRVPSLAALLGNGDDAAWAEFWREGDRLRSIPSTPVAYHIDHWDRLAGGEALCHPCERGSLLSILPWPEGY